MTLKLETNIWWKNEATDLRVLAQARLHVTPSTDCEGMKSIDRLIQTSHDRNVASHFSVFWVCYLPSHAPIHSLEVGECSSSACPRGGRQSTRQEGSGRACSPSTGWG
jgi:hypothetical protein